MALWYNNSRVDFGSGTNGALNVPNNTTKVLSANAYYTTGYVGSGATLIIPRTIDVRFNGELLNYGMINGGGADVNGSGSAYTPSTAYDLLPYYTNGAASTNRSWFSGRGSVKIMAETFTNYGSINTSGSSYNEYGANGNGAGFILIITNLMQGSGSLACWGGSGTSGNVDKRTYAWIQQTCNGYRWVDEVYRQGASGCGSGGSGCNKWPEHEWHTRDYYSAGHSEPTTYDCSYTATYGGIEYLQGYSGNSSSILIISSQSAKGGNQSSQPQSTIIGRAPVPQAVWYTLPSEAHKLFRQGQTGN